MLWWKYLHQKHFDCVTVCHTFIFIQSSLKVRSVNGLLPEEREVRTAKDCTPRLLEPDKQTAFSGLLLVLPSVPVHAGHWVATAHALAMSACLHGVSSVLTSWESSLGFFRLVSLCTKVTQRPIHAREWLHSWTLCNCR